jgi:prepilin-type N-terminal cleavage/methylation domain-containing protein
MRMPTRKQLSRRSGFTLIELMLSLALIVVATALIGSLMQIYASNFAVRGDDIRRAQLARSILSMIAEDIRSVVTKQEYDPTVLEQLLGASGNGGAAPTSEASAGGLASSAEPGLASGDSDETDLAETATTSLPPGIYGTQYQLMVDVSRVPRPDEYMRAQQSIVAGSLTDIPGDMKTVTYYVQTATTMGVSDAMAAFGSGTDNQGYNSGLVRRQLDRAVTAYAEENGDTQRLLQTGDLMAPEVISLEFAFFDGTQWLTEWDSSTQSLPWLVQISLAMQTEKGARASKLEPGTQISMLSLGDRQQYGVQVYELVVAIPGAQLRAADAASADQAAGMESMGL